MSSTTSLRVPRRALPTCASSTDVAVTPVVREAIELRCQGSSAVQSALGVKVSAADALLDELHADLGRLAHDSFTQVMLEPDKQRAVERAVQTVFEMYA